jgi:hypothetical protein
MYGIYRDLVRIIQKEKLKMIHRMQEQGETSGKTMDNRLSRVADHLAVPNFPTSPTALGEIEEAELKDCRMWATSMIQHVNREGFSLAKKGEDYWAKNEAGDWTINTRVPRLIQGLSKSRTARWLRKHDVLTYGDLLISDEIIVSEEDYEWKSNQSDNRTESVHSVDRELTRSRITWRDLPYDDDEPLWWNAHEKLLATFRGVPARLTCMEVLHFVFWCRVGVGRNNTRDQSAKVTLGERSHYLSDTN